MPQAYTFTLNVMKNACHSEKNDKHYTNSNYRKGACMGIIVI